MLLILVLFKLSGYVALIDYVLCSIFTHLVTNSQADPETGIFHYPVTLEEAPTYYDVIKGNALHSICISIKVILQSKKHRSHRSVHDAKTSG